HERVATYQAPASGTCAGRRRGPEAPPRDDSPTPPAVAFLKHAGGGRTGASGSGYARRRCARARPFDHSLQLAVYARQGGPVRSRVRGGVRVISSGRRATCARFAPDGGPRAAKDTLTRQRPPPEFGCRLDVAFLAP